MVQTLENDKYPNWVKYQHGKDYDEDGNLVSPPRGEIFRTREECKRFACEKATGAHHCNLEGFFYYNWWCYCPVSDEDYKTVTGNEENTVLKVNLQESEYKKYPTPMRPC